MTDIKLDQRYVARVVLEAKTPLNIASGESDLVTDSTIAVDANGLPIIPGTSLCGVIRHILEKHMGKEDVNNVFGFQKDSSGKGSRILFSHGHLVGSGNTVAEGMFAPDPEDSFYSELSVLPVRDHCRINERGTAEKGGKFDEQVLYKGARFAAEIELQGSEDDSGFWKEVLGIFRNPLFRIGGGTRKGFGKLTIKDIRDRKFNLKDNTDLQEYLNLTGSLNKTDALKPYSIDKGDDPSESADCVTYTLTLEPEDFFMFGAGFGDAEVDMKPVYEKTIQWDNEDRPSFSDEMLLIPASSIKGAVAHRTAYHYNLEKGIYADQLGEESDTEGHTGKNNDAVRLLFGCAKDSNEKEGDLKTGRRGAVILSDMHYTRPVEKVFNHVAIDRFTGGALNSALYDEKVSHSLAEPVKIEITVENTEKIREENQKALQAFEKALLDITNGMLPLGGGVNRGHGCFTGTLYKNSEEISEATI